MKYLIIFLVGCSIGLCAGEHLIQQSEPVKIVGLKIIANSDSNIQTAKHLGSLLGKIYTSSFEVIEGGGNSGITVGTAADFPELNFKPQFNIHDFAEQQGYEIKTHPQGIYIIGATPLAVRYAVADFLHRLGYRYYFPPKKWEIFPVDPPETLALHIREVPDYYMRRIWPGWGIWPEMRGPDKENECWKIQNRDGGILLRTGHIYGTYIRRNAKTFEQHPEYYALYKGERKSSKLCISNSGLRKLVCDYAIKEFRENPQQESISADPSDGGGWCECEECEKLGSPSNRALFLANQIAEAVNAEFPGKLVGIYAYNMHSPPPTIKVHPQVVVSIATSFIRDGWTLDELIAGWRAQGATIGIREYYYARHAPGEGQGTNLAYIAQSIPELYKKGARYMSAESSDAWATGGLGYYISERLLWNIETDPIAVKDDFLKNAFPESQEAMRKFYQLLDGGKRRPLNADLLGRMYRILDEAWKLASKPDELARVNALTCYTRFAELLFIHELEQSLDSYKKLLAFGASIKAERLVHTYAMSRDSRRLLPAKFKANPPEINWENHPEPTEKELAAFIKTGMEKYQLLNFEPMEFSNNLQLTVFPGNDHQETLSPVRGLRRFYIWSDGKPFTLEITGGLIKRFRNRGNVKVELVQIGGHSNTGELETVIQKDSSVPPDGNAYQVKLTPKHSGLHRIVIDDGHDMTRINWPKNLSVSMPVDHENAPPFSGNFYFYVPKGTKIIGYYAKLKRGRIIAPDKQIAAELQATNGFYSFNVPAGSDGKVWKLQGLNGVIRLLTVPSCLSLNSNKLLIPVETIKENKL